MPDARALPRISVVTPSFNQGPYLERTIRSVLDQNYPNLEYLIVDGGSTDESLAIIKKYERHLAYWVSEPDAGQSNAINKGLTRATGTILAWLNSDDYYLPGTFEAITEASLAHPEAGAFVGTGEIVNTSGTVVYRKKALHAIGLETLYNWLDGGDFIQPACFFRSAAWRAVGPLDESLHIAFDVDLWLRMARAGCTFLAIDRLLSQALSHPNAKTTAFMNLMRVDCAIVVMRHGGERAARKHLEDMAIRLAWSEPNLNQILKNPVVRLLRPLIARFVKPAARRGDTMPQWLQRSVTLSDGPDRLRSGRPPVALRRTKKGSAWRWRQELADSAVDDGSAPGMERARVIRVVSYPDDDRNPYFALFYRALEPYGVAVTYTNAIDDRMLRQPGHPFDVLHFHWGLEHIWRWRNRGRLWEMMSLVGWARFLRLAKRKGVRIVWTTHELAPAEAGRWFDVLGYAMCAYAADLCICHSGYVRKLLVRRFRVSARKVVTLPIGTYFDTVPAPAGRAAANAEFGVSASSRLLVCFGDLRPRKGIEVAVRATELLGNAYELVVAGSAPTTVHQAWIRDLERACRATPNVTVRIERLQDQVLATLLGAADCVLLPYLQIFGSSAFSLCLALGRGVVASDLPYFREVLSLEPKAGVLARPGDPAALAHAVEEFFSEPPAVRHEAARRLGEKLAWDKIIPPVGKWFATKGPRRPS